MVQQRCCLLRCAQFSILSDLLSFAWAICCCCRQVADFGLAVKMDHMETHLSNAFQVGFYLGFGCVSTVIGSFISVGWCAHLRSRQVC